MVENISTPRPDSFSVGMTPPARIDRWVEIKFAEGKLANFLKVPNRRIELCTECFDKLTNIPI
jgi:hypothetical protein